MSSSFTYATLQDLVTQTLEDAGEEFLESYDALLKTAEEVCVSDLSLDIWRVADAMTLTQGSQLASLPSGFLRLFSLHYTASNSRIFLEKRTYEYLIDYWPSTANTGTPLYWAPYTLTTTTPQVYIAPTPSATRSATGWGLKRPASLVTDTSGTWLSLNAGRLLYLATLVAGEQHNVSDERIAMWKTEYAEELARKRIEFQGMISPEFALPE